MMTQTLTGSLGVLVVPVIAFGLTAYFLMASTRQLARTTVSHVDQALEVVRQRFARGEIDAQEYSRLVAGLTRTA
jgi:uncharacterized membrane protein